MEKDDNKYVGRAYAFFDCRYSKKQIEEAVPQIREVEANSGLELSLTENPEKIRDNRELTDSLEVAKDLALSKLVNLPADQKEEARRNISYRYVLEAKYPKKGNDAAATRLVTIMNGMYMSTPLWEHGEDFFGRIIYKHGDSYVVAER